MNSKTINPSQNIRFDYFYRDAGNYKLFNSVVFSNKRGLSIEHIVKVVKISFIDKGWFDPLACGLPQLKFEKFDEELDSDWHELSKICFTDQAATMDIDISDFLITALKVHHNECSGLNEYKFSL